MFYSLTGKIVYVDAAGLAIDCGGVAFRVNTSLMTLKKTGRIGDIATVYTYMSVREDAIELYGFADNAELELFRMLIGVTGVGPKAAIAVLSAFEPDVFALTVAAGDSKSITRAQGIGPKIAQRIVLELKDKLAKTVPSEIAASKINGQYIGGLEGSRSEAISALMALGYNRNEAAQALSDVAPSLSVEDAVKAGLKVLMRRL